MAIVRLKAYEVRSTGVKTMIFDEVYAKYRTTFFPDAKTPTEGYKAWTKIKESIVKKDKGVKKEDDIYYVAKNMGNDLVVIFAIGNDKKETLEKIYLKEKEDETETPAVEKEPVKETTKKVDGWDLSDTSKSIKEHVQAINEGKTIIGKFNEEQSKQIVHAIGQGKVNSLVNDKNYDELAKMLISNTKLLSKALDYTIYDKMKIGELIKDLCTVQMKRPDIESLMNEVSGEDFDYNILKKE